MQQRHIGAAASHVFGLSRSHIGALLLSYYTDDGRSLHYAGRAHTGTQALAGVLVPLQVLKMPLAEPPPVPSMPGASRWLITAAA